MHRLFTIALLTGLATVSFGSLVPAHASADTEVTLRVSGITVVGEVDNRLWAATLSLLGCTWRNLGASPMTDNYVIHGTDGDDTIRVLNAPLVWCNRLILPANQNGRSIQVYGGARNDVIYGGGSAPFSGNPNWIFGEEGDDTLYLGPGGARGEGGPGNDTIYGGDSAGDVLLGGDGDDALCEHAATVALTLDGGDGGADTSCSETATNGYTGIESTDCLWCGFGY